MGSYQVKKSTHTQDVTLKKMLGTGMRPKIVIFDTVVPDRFVYVCVFREAVGGVGAFHGGGSLIESLA